MVNRLILNLIQGADQSENSEFRTRSGQESPAFATGPYLSNIGGSVRTIFDNMDDELFEVDDVDTVYHNSGNLAV